jgi:hypothetical protein
MIAATVQGIARFGPSAERLRPLSYVPRPELRRILHEGAGRGAPELRCCYLYTLCVLGIDDAESLRCLVAFSAPNHRGNAPENVPSLLRALVQTRTDSRAAHALLNMRGDGALAEAIADDQVRLLANQETLTLSLITHDPRLFEPLAHSLGFTVWSADDRVPRMGFAAFDRFLKDRYHIAPRRQRFTATYSLLMTKAYGYYGKMGL